MSWWKKSSPGGGERALAGARWHPHGSTDRRVWTGDLLAEWENTHLTGQPGVALQSGPWLSANHRNTTPSPGNGHVTLCGPRIHEGKHSGKGLQNGFLSSRKVTVENRPPSSSPQWRGRMWNLELLPLPCDEGRQPEKKANGEERGVQRQQRAGALALTTWGLELLSFWMY